MMDPKTSDQKTLDLIRKITRTVDRGPSVRELMRELGFKSPQSVSKRLKRLEDLGVIERGDGMGEIRILKTSVWWSVKP